MNVRTCAEAQRELAWLLAEEDSPCLPAEIQEHLLKCPGCAREAQSLRALLGSLSPAAVPDPPEAYWQAFLPRLRNRLVAQGTAGPVRTSWIWGMAGMAATFLIACLLVGNWRIPPETRARLYLEQVAQGRDPDSLQQALDTLLPDSDPGVSPGERNDLTLKASDMARALEEVLPEPESGFNGATREPTPAQERRPAQSPDSGWV